jgi:hypothetical protein
MLEGSKGSTRDPIKVEVVNIDNKKPSLKENPLSIRKRKSSR